MVTKIFLSPQVQPSDISLPFSLEGYIDVGDGCLRQNVLVTIHYLASYNIQNMSPTSKFSHQHQQIVANLSSPTSRRKPIHEALVSPLFLKIRFLINHNYDKDLMIFLKKT